MNVVSSYVRDVGKTAVSGWNRFWFTPSDPATYCLIRLLAGWMMFYTHAVWTLDLEAFFGQTPWLSSEALAQRENLTEGIGEYAFSYLNYIQSDTLLWATHIAGLVVFAMFTLGLFSRVTSILAFFITVSYANRVPAALFGLDQVNSMLGFYLMIGPSGARYSLDRAISRWWKRRTDRETADELRTEAVDEAGAEKIARSRDDVSPSVSVNVAIRLIQIHLCVIYLFAALGKAGGWSWLGGEAMWLSFASLEYQSLDMTWLAEYPLLLNAMTIGSVFWELSYWALVWPRLTRPIYIGMAVAVHLGIAFCLGMITFGFAMIFANLAFVSPRLTRAVIERRTLKLPRAEEESDEQRHSVARSARRYGRRGKNEQTAGQS